MFKLATICYIDNGKEWLMLHRNKKEHDVHAGKWIGVGGKVEPGETPEECAIREIKEETGLDVLSLELKGMITFPNFTPNDDWYTYVFVITAFSGELIDCPEGSLQWVSYEKIKQLPTWEGDYIFTGWLLEHRPFFSAKFCYGQGKLENYSVAFY